MLQLGLRRDPNAAPLGDQLRLPRPYSAVTLARGFLESGAVHHGDVSAAVRDKARLSQDSHRHRHARPANSQHLGQEFLGQIEAVAADPILRHEQPARAALFDEVQPVAGGGLCHCLKDEFAVAVQESPEPGAFLHQVAKILCRQSSRRAGDLAADFVFRSLDAVKNRNPRESVVADVMASTWSPSSITVTSEITQSSGK